MPSTEFLLYLVIVIFAVFVIMNYYKDNGSDSRASKDNTQYRYIPVYKSENDNIRESLTSSSNVSDSYRSGMYDKNRRGYNNGNGNGNGYGNGNGNGNGYGNGKIDEIDIYNRQEGPGGPMGPGGMPVPPIDPLRKFDFDTINDDFTPPFRRSYYDEYNYRLNPALYPAYTRGPPGRFRKIGTLVADGVSANDQYKFLLLMGRQKWPSGGDYEYYAMNPDSDKRLKFYIETRGKEICNDDIVKISELEGYIYKFKEDKDLSPRYDPYIL